MKWDVLADWYKRRFEWEGWEKRLAVATVYQITRRISENMPKLSLDYRRPLDQRHLAIFRCTVGSFGELRHADISREVATLGIGLDCPSPASTFTP